MNSVNRFIYCIIDDVRADQFFRLIKKGILPNFQNFYGEGIYSNNCITDFPAVTYPTQVSMITGAHTGDYRKELCHGVPLYNWMERAVAPPFLRSYGTYGSDEQIQIYKMNEDIGENCQTILEMIEEGNKASILQFINRGADYFYPESKLKLAFYYLVLSRSRNVEKYLYRINSIVVQKVLETFKHPKRFFNSNEVPIASLIWFVSSDILLHLYGSNSIQYLRNMIHIDTVFGVLLEKLDQMGYLDDTAIAVTADHGNYAVNTFGNLSSFIQKYNLHNYHPRKNVKGIINLTDMEGIGFINVKPRNCYSKPYWRSPKIKDLENFGSNKINLIKELFKIKGCELMYYKDDNNGVDKGKIHLKRKMDNLETEISGFIEYRGQGRDFQIKYLMDNQNDDIFGYNKDEKAVKLMDNKFHNSIEWLEHTYHLDYPCYPELVSRHFKNPRGGDIIISTKGNVVYRIIHGKPRKISPYGHDLGLRNCSIVPLLIGGAPEIPHKEVKYCKTIDVVPTLLKTIQVKAHKSVMGQSLI